MMMTKMFVNFKSGMQFNLIPSLGLCALTVITFTNLMKNFTKFTMICTK